MKGILLGALLSLGGMVTTTSAQDYRYRPGMNDNDPQAIATNKTVILEQRAGGLTRKQEKKVYRLYKKEAKQEVKLKTLKQENREAIKEILTREQYVNVRGEHKKIRDEKNYGRTDHSGRTLHSQKKVKKSRQHTAAARCEKSCCARK